MSMTIAELKREWAGILERSYLDGLEGVDGVESDILLSTRVGMALATFAKWCDANNIYQVPNADKHPTTPGWYHLRLVSEVLK